MVTESDKENLVARELDNRICLNIITMLALVFTAAFVCVTIFAFLNIRDLDAKDAALRLDIEKLQRKMQTYRQARGDVVKGTEEFMMEVAQAAFGGDVDEMDFHADSNGFKKEATTQGGEKRERRQQINIFDAILGAQRAVFEKYCVSQNTSCLQGPRGNNGTRGDPGLKGKDGAPGKNGTKGAAGGVGGPGLRGDVGSMGQHGDQGTNGTQGIIGDMGAWGEPGLKGDRGDAGSKGLKGNMGVKGPIGDTGPAGGNGTQGVNGTKGDIGDIGLHGFNGTQGDTGSPGQGLGSLGPDCECYKKPRFHNPVDEAIVVGPFVDMKIPCTGEGNPPPNITVTKLPLKHTGKRTLEHTGNVFSIKRPTDTEYGRYVCTATNQYGSATKVITVQKPTSG